MTFGSLFAGIGGLDLGLERAGMQCKWQVEIDDYATRILERHWPDVRRWRDVTTFPPDADDSREPALQVNANGTRSRRASVEGSTEKSPFAVDLICGGFPCQDISYAGRGAGLAGERSGLFFEAIRVVRQLRPRFVLLENVAALLSRGLDVVLGTLAEIGYDAEWHCIPAAAVGAPHIRDRVFILAYRSGERPGRREQQQEGSEGPRYVANTGRGNGEGPRGTICRCTIPSRWEPEPSVGRVANGIPKRVDRLKCLGNAVVPQVAEWIGRRILDDHA